MFELVVIIHFAFIVWVAVGGFLALRWWRAALAHLPALAWAVLLEWNGWICPLTPLEKALREQRGLAGYEGGFIENYLIPIIYPAGLTREIQMALAAGLILVNAVVYAYVVYRHFFKQAERQHDG